MMIPLPSCRGICYVEVVTGLGDLVITFDYRCKRHRGLADLFLKGKVEGRPREGIIAEVEHAFVCATWRIDIDPQAGTVVTQGPQDVVVMHRPFRDQIELLLMKADIEEKR